MSEKSIQEVPEENMRKNPLFGLIRMVLIIALIGYLAFCYLRYGNFVRSCSLFYIWQKDG